MMWKIDDIQDVSIQNGCLGLQETSSKFPDLLHGTNGSPAGFARFVMVLSNYGKKDLKGSEVTVSSVSQLQ